MADRVLRTDFKRIGRSGNTVDGRVISPQMIDEMAATYKKELFTALMWPEHQRYVNYGTVEELRAEANEEGGRDLFAIISPNAFYLNANQYGQKLFFSMEITADFRKSGKAYLTGLAPTDDPASAATSEMRLSKVADQGGILLSKTIESVEKAFEDTVQLTLLDQFKELFIQHKKNEANDMADDAALQKLSQNFAEIKETLSKLTQKGTDKGDVESRLQKLSKKLTAMQQELDKTAPEQTDPVIEKLSKMEQNFATLTEKIIDLTERLSAQTPSKEAETPEANAITAEQFKSMTDQLEAFGKKLADALKEQPGTPGGEHFNADDDDSKDIV